MRYWGTLLAYSIANFCYFRSLNKLDQIGVRLPTSLCFSRISYTFRKTSDEQVTNSWFYEIPARMSHRLASSQSRHPVTLILTMSMLSFATLIWWILTTNGDVRGLRIICLAIIFYNKRIFIYQKHPKASDHESNQETQRSTVGQLVNKHKWIDRMNNWMDKMRWPNEWTTLFIHYHPLPLSALKVVAKVHQQKTTPWGMDRNHRNGPRRVTLSTEISQVPTHLPHAFFLLLSFNHLVTAPTSTLSK